MRQHLCRVAAILFVATPMAFPSSASPKEEYWIWIRPSQVRDLPDSGPAWSQMLSDANENLLAIDIGDQGNQVDSYMMAAGLVYLKMKESRNPAAEYYRARVQQACLTAIGTENLAPDALGPSRQVCGVVIAANLIDWSDAAAEARFRDWVDDVRFMRFPDGRSITSTHEERPNNWGTHAGASRLACALYLGDKTTALRCAEVFAGWLGNRWMYTGFDWGDKSWQADPNRPVGINPRGAMINGYNVDGVLPDDQRRAGPLLTDWSTKTAYTYEALQGALAQAVMLDLHNLNAWEWSDKAILRAFVWLQDVHLQPITDSVNGSDDRWQGHLINHIYGTSFPAAQTTNPGKAIGYTDWTSLNPDWP